MYDCFFTACNNTTKANKEELTNQVPQNTEQNLPENIEESIELNKENEETEANLSETAKQIFNSIFFLWGECRTSGIRRYLSFCKYTDFT